MGLGSDAPESLCKLLIVHPETDNGDWCFGKRIDHYLEAAK